MSCCLEVAEFLEFVGYDLAVLDALHQWELKSIRLSLLANLPLTAQR